MVKTQPGGNDIAQLKIRPAVPDDFDEIINLFDSWAPDHWDTEFATKYYRTFFDNRDCCPMDEVFVGSIEDRIVGVTGYCPDEDVGTDDVYWLNWFYVHKDHTEHGYGGDLLDCVIEELKNKKARKLYVDTTSYHFYKDARKLYGKKGFKQEGVLKDYYGKGEHQVIFGLDL